MIKFFKIIGMYVQLLFLVVVGSIAYSFAISIYCIASAIRFIKKTIKNATKSRLPKI